MKKSKFITGSAKWDSLPHGQGLRELDYHWFGQPKCSLSCDQGWASPIEVWVGLEIGSLNLQS